MLSNPFQGWLTSQIRVSVASSICKTSGTVCYVTLTNKGLSCSCRSITVPVALLQLLLMKIPQKLSQCIQDQHGDESPFSLFLIQTNYALGSLVIFRLRKLASRRIASVSQQTHCGTVLLKYEIRSLPWLYILCTLLLEVQLIAVTYTWDNVISALIFVQEDFVFLVISWTWICAVFCQMGSEAFL